MCTRVLWNTNDLAVLTGRSMDWPESTQPLIVGFPPRGRDRDGSRPARLVDDPNPLRWTSRYASLVTTVYGLGTVDGLNEAGLAGHGLYLNETDFGGEGCLETRRAGRAVAAVSAGSGGHRAEALRLMDQIQLVKVSAHGRDANLHLALEDAGGDSAVIEFAQGARWSTTVASTR